MTVDTSYLAGNPVYQGGTPQPTQGTVDPTGYVDRSLGTGGSSDSRSGLAANALDNLQQQNQSLQTSPNTTPTGTVNPTRNDQGQYYHTPVTAATSQQATPYSGTPVGVQVVWPNGQTANEMYTPKSQEEYNQLAQNGWKYNVTADMSNILQSPATQQGLDALQQSEITNRTAMQQAMQNKLSGITQAEGFAQEQEPQQLAANRANFGGRGMLFSSGFANAEQNVLDAIARRLSGYEQQANDVRTGYNTDLQKFLDSLTEKRTGLYNQQASYDTQQLQDANVRAAIERQLGLTEGNNIGLGRQPTPVKAPAPAPKPAPKPASKSASKPAPKTNRSPIAVHKNTVARAILSRPKKGTKK